MGQENTQLVGSIYCNPMAGHMRYEKTLDRILLARHPGGASGVRPFIGPFHRSARGHRFVLVLVDYATRYPEAVPLRNIFAESVAQAVSGHLVVRISKEILTDQGTLFMPLFTGDWVLSLFGPVCTTHRPMVWWRWSV